MEGLPIGNGCQAAMVWGDASSDRLSLNHEWLWRGMHRERDNETVSHHLPEVRKYLAKGDFMRGTSLANTYFGGDGGVMRSILPRRVDSYQPAGDLVFILDDTCSFLRRELDIDRAVARTLREAAESVVESAFLAHSENKCLLAHWQTNSRDKMFSGRMMFSRPEDPDAKTRCQVDGDGIRFTCEFIEGIVFEVMIRVVTDGIVLPSGNCLIVRDALELTAIIRINVDIPGRSIAHPPFPGSSWEELLSSHTSAFSSFMGRFRMGISLPECHESMPTDKRIDAVKAGGSDPSLMLLYILYGRYLLASSSICGELPANLQGKWNDKIDPPWESDYHFDINIEMNYWMAEASNMPECAEALLHYAECFMPHARKAAHDLYGCRGIWMPLQGDAWCRATPEAHGYAVWVGAAPWIAQHFWWHYTYRGDLEFLRKRAYPFFREVALFYEDYLVEGADGRMHILPSQSPENRFSGTGSWPVSICVSSAMDVQLAYDALGYAVTSARILDVDGRDADRWEDFRNRLPPFRIGSDGRLLEWDREMTESEPGHRHLSHLYGLFPSTLFNPIERPAQYDAAIHSLKTRLEKGGGHTGWSRAWVACLCARMGDGEGLSEHLNGLIKDFATASLLDLHPPRIFQIDGNLGAVAAVLEGLAQSWGGRIHLLRALPPAWSGGGSVTGLRVPGGHSLSLSWKEGKVTSLEVILGYTGQADFSLPGREDAVEVRGEPGQVLRPDLL